MDTLGFDIGLHAVSRVVDFLQDREPVDVDAVRQLLAPFWSGAANMRVEAATLRLADRARRDGLALLTCTPGWRKILAKYTPAGGGSGYVGELDGIPMTVSVRFTPRGEAQVMDYEFVGINPVAAVCLGLAAFRTGGYQLKQCQFVKCRRWFVHITQGRSRPREYCPPPRACAAEATEIANRPKDPQYKAQRGLMRRYEKRGK